MTGPTIRIGGGRIALMETLGASGYLPTNGCETPRSDTHTWADTHDLTETLQWSRSSRVDLRALTREPQSEVSTANSHIASSQKTRNRQAK